MKTQKSKKEAKERRKPQKKVKSYPVIGDEISSGSDDDPRADYMIKRNSNPKAAKTFFLILSSMFFTYSNAQVIDVPEPDFAGTVLYVSEAGSVQELEKKTASVAVGFTKNTSNFSIPGCCSDIIVDSVNLRFIIRVSDNSIDPQNILSIVAVEKTKDGKRKTPVFIKEKVEFSATRYKQNSVLVSISKMPAGEYGIHFNNTYGFNLFAVR